jgi:hypothetical protein
VRYVLGNSGPNSKPDHTGRGSLKFTMPLHYLSLSPLVELYFFTNGSITGVKEGFLSWIGMKVCSNCCLSWNRTCSYVEKKQSGELIFLLCLRILIFVHFFLSYLKRFCWGSVSFCYWWLLSSVLMHRSGSAQLKHNLLYVSLNFSPRRTNHWKADHWVEVFYARSFHVHNLHASWSTLSKVG